MDIPEGAIPAEQFQPQQAPQAMSSPSVSVPHGAIPEDQFESQEDTYGTPGQQLKSFLEGAASGIAGPLAPMVEKAAGVKPEAIRGRAAANPISHGVGEAAGLGAGFLTGTGEAAAMTKAGELAAGAAGLGKTAEAASYGYKVGSSAVKQAAEMAVLQGSDETAKMILQDPEASATSALANIGLAAALGGGTGAFVTGAVSPLWNATAGPKLESFLGAVKDHLNGGSKLALPEEREAAAKILGIELDPLQRAAVTDDIKPRDIASTLRRSEHPEMIESLDKLHHNMSNSVMESLGVDADGVQNYSQNAAGHELADTFSNEIKEHYDPAKKAMDARDEAAAPIRIPDDTRLQHAGKMLEDGIQKIGTDAPAFKLYDHYSQRLLAKDTIGEVDALKTEISNEIKKANRAGDFNTSSALQDIKQSMSNLQEQQIAKSADTADLLVKRQEQNRMYAAYANKMDTALDHLGLGDFKGTKGLLSKITESLSPEELYRKMSIKGNSDLIPFLKENFPATFEKILSNERKELIKPAVLAAAKKGENPIDVNKLSEIINKTRAGKKEYVDAILPPEAIKRIDAAKVLSSSVVNPKDSGTPAGLAKILKHMPASAMAAMSWVMGHGPVAGWMAGHASELVGKNAPEAIKLAYLKFLTSEQPVKAQGFKAMVDFIHATQKGENMLSKAAVGVFKSGVQVLTDAQMPVKADLMKLDKLVAKHEKEPDKFMQAQGDGHVGHYLSDQQAALSKTSTQAMQYLQSIKPRPHQTGPLDKPIQPSSAEEARYHRALQIAQQPAVVLQRIKDGSLQLSDLTDLKSMYPAYYTRAVAKLTNEMAQKQSDEEMIPYKTRLAVSLFLGQPMDASMQPQSILAAQPKPQQPMQQKPQGTVKRSTSALGKNPKTYRTPGQAAEADRSDRD